MKFSSVAVKELRMEGKVVGWAIVGVFRTMQDRFAKCDIYGSMEVYHQRDIALEHAKQFRKGVVIDSWRRI